MIPTNRPVLGKDLDTVRQQLSLDTQDAIWLYGLSMTRWTNIVRNGADLPVKDPSLALLVRLLDKYPELSAVPKLPSSPEIYELLKGCKDIDQRRFSVLLGSEATAGYRWLKIGTRPSPAVKRLMHYLKVAINRRMGVERSELLDEWSGVVEVEARARGVPSVFRTGGWNRKFVAEMTQKIQDSIPASSRPQPKKGYAGRMVLPKDVPTGVAAKKSTRRGGEAT